MFGNGNGLFRVNGQMLLQIIIQEGTHVVEARFDNVIARHGVPLDVCTNQERNFSLEL